MCVIAQRIECISITWYTLSIWVLNIAKTAQTGEKSDVVNNHVVGFDQNEFFVTYMCYCMSQVAALLRMRGGFRFVVEL